MLQHQKVIKQIIKDLRILEFNITSFHDEEQYELVDKHIADLESIQDVLKDMSRVSLDLLKQVNTHSSVGTTSKEVRSGD